jgi:hypothetical protein
MKKRAQLAVETLLIYGVAILIVMVAIGALIATGVLKPDTLLPDECKLGNTLTCENYEITPSGVQVELRNSYGKNIQQLYINIEGKGDTEGLWKCTETAYANVIVNGELSSPIFIPCDIQVPKGNKIRGIVTVKFNPVGSQINRSITGSIFASVTG